MERRREMASMNISLPEQMREWVQAQIEAGKYASSSDYIRDLIRQDQERRDKVSAIQRAIDEGLASGEAEEFDFADFKHGMMKRAQ